jgi:tetratricopeptide (TPR) repeat protein
MKALLLFTLAAAFQDHPDALSEAAKALAVEKRYEQAAALWKRALESDPGHFPSLFNLGLMYHSLARYAEAEPLLSRAARVQPREFNTRYVRGSTLLRLARREDALRQWRAALDLQPANTRLMQVVAVEYGNGAYFREACDLARRALGLADRDPNVWFIAIKACYDARDPVALELARQAAGKFPDSARANFEYGFQLQKIGQTGLSRPYLEKAMKADPSYEEPFFFYGDLLLKEDHFAGAEGPLRTALRNRPDYVAACMSLARALMGLQKFAEAVQEIEGCIRANPKHPQPHLLLSQLYYRLGDEQRARTEKETSVRLRRANPELMESPQVRPFPSP